MVISVKRNAHGHIKIGVDAPKDWPITREARGTPRVPKSLATSLARVKP